MVLILSNIANEAAAQLADMFPPGAASLLTASAFHKQFSGGFNVNDFSASRFKIDGRDMTAADVTGVVSTIANFIPEEFYYIEEADRKYVCSEMNAFFIYFLSQLDCPKINPSTARSFSGEFLHKIEWIKKAQSAGVPVWSVHLVNCQTKQQENKAVASYTCSVLGDKLIGDEPPGPVADYVFALQQAFGVPFLSCRFSEDGSGKFYLTDVSQKPDISTEAGRKAIFDYFA